MTTSPVSGELFPEFSLPDASGKQHNLSSYKGKYVVLYLYPKDDTPGCTREACNFRDQVVLRLEDTALLGLSADDSASHASFAEKYSLPFPLLSDKDAAFAKSIGSFGPRQMGENVVMQIKRQTFLINPQGYLVHSWLEVAVDGHADEVVARILEEKAK